MALQEDTGLTVTITPTYEILAQPGQGAAAQAGASKAAEGGTFAKTEPMYLMVNLLSASNLPIMDDALHGGKCDPYCKVRSCSSSRACSCSEHRARREVLACDLTR